MGLPDDKAHNWIFFIGFALNGVAQGFIFIPLLPDALEAVFIKEKIIEGKNDQLDQLISDYGSGLYGTFFSTGQILAPIVGSAIYEAIDYRPTTDLMTAVCLSWALIFFVFNVGFNILSKERQIHENTEKLREQWLANKSKDDENGGEIKMVEDNPGNSKGQAPIKSPKQLLSGMNPQDYDEKDHNEDVMEFLERKRK